MGPEGFYNILIYSHDTYGLGHIRRTMAIAAQLRADNVNVLILTGSPIAGRFSFPENVDFVRIPGMIKKTNDEYHSLSIRIDSEHALNIRRSIILTTAKTFRPHLFLVDKEPLGLKKEVLPTLEWMQRYSPATKTVLGLRDIMDDRETVRADWVNKDVYRLLDELYSEIWVYGQRSIYDAVEEYAIPGSIEQKIVFTGYLPRRVASGKNKAKVRKKFCVRQNDQMIVVTAGGGGDGYDMMDCYLRMHEVGAFRTGKSILVTGPFMPLSKRRKLAKRGRKLGIKLVPFYPQMEELIGAAEVVVSMGGYNTMCEILSQKTPSLIIPRETPRKEQLIRAEALQQKQLIEYLPWPELTPENLGHKMNVLLSNLKVYQQAMDQFELKGIECIKKRLEAFRSTH